ncbi:hypothetical protein KL938_004790 [Ogataea parapolymorpha]|nr:hypothetical protein KL938_004790 [Ogataea parapolymorpha]
MTSDSETAATDPAEALRLIPPEPTADEQFSLAQVAAGCKVYAIKDGEWRLAEILALQRKKGKPVYYVHYAEFNKRLDEWIDETKIDTHRPMYPPKPQKDKKEKKQTRKKVVRKTAPKSETPEPQRATSEPNEDEMDLDNLNVQGLVKEGEELSREDEIERLRTSGSMAQTSTSELAKIRNFSKVIIGNHEVEPWYFSPYPVELTEEDVLGRNHLCFAGGERNHRHQHRRDLAAYVHDNDRHFAHAPDAQHAAVLQGPAYHRAHQPNS